MDKQGLRCTSVAGPATASILGRMRVVVVADVHANIEAFQAVLRDAEEGAAVDAVWSLGDLVGYGPDPIACIEMLQRYPHEAVSGNHDLAAAGVIGVEDFNPYAAAAAQWTATRLSEETKAWLAGLPRVSGDEHGFTLTHGSLNDPTWEYLVLPDAAQEHMAQQTTPYGLVGHTHFPRVFYDAGLEVTSVSIADGSVLPLDEARFVANPGSVGQPRDGDPRAAYAVVDTEARRLSFHRVEYEITLTQRKMREAGLPDVLWQRLMRGR